MNKYSEDDMNECLKALIYYSPKKEIDKIDQGFTNLKENEKLANLLLKVEKLKKLYKINKKLMEVGIKNGISNSFTTINRKGKELDYVLVSEITAYYDEDSEEYAKIIKELISKKISVLEEEPKDEITEEFDASKVEEVSIDDFDNLPPSIKVDDPVRMYLKEIGKLLY